MSQKGFLPSSANHTWRPLQLFNLYRFALSISLLTISHHNSVSLIFPGSQPENFIQISISYALFAFVMLLLSFSAKIPYRIQANLPIYCDIIFLILIMHCCGGVISGMGLLLIILVAAHSILYPGKYALLTAAISTIALLSEYTYMATYQNYGLKFSGMAGLIGILIFFAAVFVNFLSVRVRKNQTIILKQATLLDSSMKMNSHIVALMHQGVMLLDSQNQIQTLNIAAKKLFGLKESQNNYTLDTLPQAIQHSIFAWQKNNQNLSPIQITSNLSKVRLEFQDIGQDQNKNTLIFIYDIAAENRQAQDLKLASLGHLTANIAHELRNPLGAASHAAQLLRESQSLSCEDKQLSTMILQNCDRMNQVIKNVLSLSGQKSNMQTIPLNEWLQKQVPTLQFSDFPNAKIILSLCKENIHIFVDSTQLTQIIVNLCENGLRHHMKKNGVAQVCLRTQYHAYPKPQVTIDIINHGDSIPDDIQEFIFEPFYTTEKSGTGLGLFLTRELCQINNAQIQYTHQHAESQFRLTFPGENSL
tara:strand:+ start:42745 stop:44340 length:1596 start_codon:yes stop_codon:yes gene_type:complete